MKFVSVTQQTVYTFYLHAVFLLVSQGTTIFTGPLTEFSGQRILFGEGYENKLN